MADETEPTPEARPPAEEHAPDRTDEQPGATRGTVQIPKWLAVSAAALALAGGGFAIGRATASDNHGGLVPIANTRLGGGPGGPDRRGGPGGPDGPGPIGRPGGAGGNGGEYRGGNNGSGDTSENNGSNSTTNGGSNSNEYGGSNGSTTPSTTPGTGT